MIDINSAGIFKSLAAFGLIAMLAACSDSDSIVFDPNVPPQNVQVVAGDGFNSEVQNTISWTLDTSAEDYVVYWSNTPGVTTSSSVVVPAVAAFSSAIHTGVDVVAGSPYYYAVQAVSGGESSVLSAEVTGTPQLSVNTNQLNDVAWNGVNTLVAVGDSGVIITSPNGLADPWVNAANTVNPVGSSLAGVTWEGINNQFLIVGAGGTVLSGAVSNWTLEPTPVASDLEDVAWLGDRYIAVGTNGTIITSNGDGSVWTEQNSGVDTTITLNGVAGNGDGSRIVVVGTNGTILTSADGAIWSQLPAIVNNQLNDVTWDGSQFVAVGSDDTILISADGVSWASFNPGTSDISFIGVTQWDSSLPADPVLAAVGSSGDFVLSPDDATGFKVETGTNEQLSGITWVDNVTPAYFVMVGNDGTVLTNQLHQ